jgi:hypothetical protein
VLQSFRWKEPPSVETLEKGIGREVRKAQLEKTLNQALNNRFRPCVSVDYRFNVIWLPAPAKPTKAQISRYRDSGNQLSKFPISEMSAIQIALEMATAGTVGRIRQCRCGEWFMANTNKKLVCSGACRFKKYQEKKEVKEKRKMYMKTYQQNPRVKARRKLQRIHKGEQRTPTKQTPMKARK